ncbi:glutamine synthetase (plasmid) [Streptomyces sp. BI20]|uniref:glutamine synthetase n=1 Tax=Streptomyces sp. BI20 TaxID=3403460 RepID=UPI003C776875
MSTTDCAPDPSVLLDPAPATGDPADGVTKGEPAGLTALRRDLEAGGVHGIAVTVVDNAGITRVKGVPVARLADAVTSGVGYPPVYDVALVDDSFTNSAHIGGPIGDMRMVADPERLTALAASPGWAWAPADRYEQSGAPYAGCHRLFARRMTERAREAGLELRVGFETEWTVTLSEEDSASPFHGPGHGMARLTAAGGYAARILRALRSQGVDVLQLHPEYSPGQFELSTAPTDPVHAADLVVLVQETVRAVTRAEGWVANFGPVVRIGEVGNGRHVHFSLWRNGVNLCHAPDRAVGMSEPAESFVAGVLSELPAMSAIGNPSTAGYLRRGPHTWSGAYACWGVENREAAVRFIPGDPRRPATANVEVKCFDAAASPYLVVGSVVAAGLAGLAEGLALPDPVVGDPAEADPRIAPPLPVTLAEAVARFRASDVLPAALGVPLAEALLAVREGDIALFADAEPQAIADATRHRY